MNDIDVSTFVRAANANGGGKPDFSRISTIDGLDVKGKRVLVRVDFNVPIKDGIVGRHDTHHARACRQSSSSLAGGAKVIVLSHLGRPKGRHDARHLAAAGRRQDGGADARHQGDASSTIASATRLGVASMRSSLARSLVLENLRYNDGEEKNDPGLRQRACRARRHLCQRRLFSSRIGRMPRSRPSPTFCRLMPAS